MASVQWLISPARARSLRPTSMPDLFLLHKNLNSSFYTPSLSLSRPTRLSVSCAVRFRPCIDIHTGKVKQIVGSTLRDSKDDGTKLVTNFESDKSAAELANLYKEDGLTGGLQIGGGINSDNSLNYIEEGASHVIVTSYVFNNGQMDLERLKDLVHVVGKQRLVLDLSCRKKTLEKTSPCSLMQIRVLKRMQSVEAKHIKSILLKELKPVCAYFDVQDGKYAIVTDRRQKFSDVYLDKRVLDFLARYAAEFLVHGVDVEGKKLGIDEVLVTLLGKHSPIPVTYAGGVTTMADLEKIKVAGLGHVDVTVGSALDIFGGNLAYKDVLAWQVLQETSTVQ